MAAHYFGNEVKETKRYQLGKVLGGTARHFLLMTATPHAGKEEDFQLFMALLDSDRFEGKARDGVHTADISRPHAADGEGEDPAFRRPPTVPGAARLHGAATSCPTWRWRSTQQVTEYVARRWAGLSGWLPKEKAGAETGSGSR